jgi:hypothetical protein
MGLPCRCSGLSFSESLQRCTWYSGWPPACDADPARPKLLATPDRAAAPSSLTPESPSFSSSLRVEPGCITR